MMTTLHLLRTERCARSKIIINEICNFEFPQKNACCANKKMLNLFCHGVFYGICSKEQICYCSNLREATNKLLWKCWLFSFIKPKNLNHNHFFLLVRVYCSIYCKFIVCLLLQCIYLLEKLCSITKAHSRIFSSLSPFAAEQKVIIFGNCR